MQIREQFNFTMESEDVHSIMIAIHMMKGSPQAMVLRTHAGIVGVDTQKMVNLTVC